MENKSVLAEQTGLRLNELLQLAKTDKHTLNTLLRNYMPFIRKCVSSVFFKNQSKEDNLTDAMLAFAHSVQTYIPENGAFVQYAGTVIRNRLLDNVRKELSLQKKDFSFSSLAKEDGMEEETALALNAYDRAEDERNLRLEIETVNNEFSGWGFSWASLLKKCPKQERSRRIAQRIANAVLESPELLADTLKNRQLPLTRLSQTFPRKTLDKYRQYIAALIILSKGDYPFVYSFVPRFFVEEEEA